MIDKKLINEGLRLAKGAVVYDTPIENLTKKEAVALLALAHKEIRDLHESHAQDLNFLEELKERKTLKHRFKTWLNRLLVKYGFRKPAEFKFKLPKEYRKSKMRNADCLCGSGKKFKDCCYDLCE